MSPSSVILVEWTRYFGLVAVVPFVLFLSTWWMLAGAVAGWLGRQGVTAAPLLASVGAGGGGPGPGPVRRVPLG